MEEKKTKTIVQQLDDIVLEFCNDYCKWPEQWDEEREGVVLWDGPCRDCPLNRLR